MRDYFELQLAMTNRKIKEAGVNPALGYFLGSIAFVSLSEYIFRNTEFAKYLVILACLSFQFRLTEKDRTDFLLSTFGDRLKIKIRVVENLIISTPFVFILVYKSLYPEAIILLLCSITIALFSFHANLNCTIPTPFSKNPFEFSVGFRKTILILPLTYVLTAISIYVGNFNLGIFSMLLLFLITLSYYSRPEEEFYVWVHADTPKSFLMRKMMSATKNAALFTLPISLGLLIFYPAEYDLILLFLFIGILFLWTMVLAKYAAFPSEINLPEGIIIAFALSFPPLILLIIPYFYTKSIKNLRLILNDNN